MTDVASEAISEALVGQRELSIKLIGDLRKIRDWADPAAPPEPFTRFYDKMTDELPRGEIGRAHV